MVRMAGFRRVGRGQQPAFHAFKVKALSILERSGLKIHRRERGLDDIPVNLFVIHLRVLGRVGVQQLLVSAQERRGVDAPLVPDQREPTLRLENADELRANALTIEPVKRLAGGDEIDAVSGQRGRFSGGGDTDEAIIAPQQLFAGFSHFAIGFNAQNSLARLEEQLGQHQGSCGQLPSYPVFPVPVLLPLPKLPTE